MTWKQKCRTEFVLVCDAPHSNGVVPVVEQEAEGEMRNEGWKRMKYSSFFFLLLIVPSLPCLRNLKKRKLQEIVPSKIIACEMKRTF